MRVGTRAAGVVVGLLLMTAESACSDGALTQRGREVAAPASHTLGTSPSPSQTPTPLGFDRPIAAVIPVGFGPNAMTAGFGSVWVENHRGSDVTRIDPRTNAEADRIAVKVHCDIEATPDGIWVPDSFGTAASRIDPVTLKTNGSVAIPRPCGIAGDGKAAWIVSPEAGQLWVVDAKSLEVEEKVDVGDLPFDVAIGDGGVWVGGEEKGGMVTRVDPHTRKVVGKIRTPGAVDVEVAFGSVWSTGRNAEALYRIDPATNQVTAKIPMGPSPEGSAAGAGAIWVTDNFDGSLRKIDPATNKVVGKATLELDDPEFQVAAHIGVPLFAFGSLWVGALDANVVLRIDPHQV